MDTGQENKNPDETVEFLKYKLFGRGSEKTSVITGQLNLFNCAISNNLSENSIRPFKIGRKNWLFSGSPRGAEASATVYSIIETAKANGLEPYSYFEFLFKNLPDIQFEVHLKFLEEYSPSDHWVQFKKTQ